METIHFDECPFPISETKKAAPKPIDVWSCPDFDKACVGLTTRLLCTYKNPKCRGGIGFGRSVGSNQGEKCTLKNNDQIDQLPRSITPMQ